MNRDEIWEECIAEGLAEAGIEATKDQIQTVASYAQGLHENYGTYTGDEHIPNPIKQENDELKRKLKHEQELVHCKPCNGTGRIITPGPYHSSDTQCWQCSGNGKVHPINIRGRY
jgi:hypothetical protein